MTIKKFTHSHIIWYNFCCNYRIEINSKYLKSISMACKCYIPLYSLFVDTFDTSLSVSWHAISFADFNLFDWYALEKLVIFAATITVVVIGN